jgi:ParB-like nuclease domain
MTIETVSIDSLRADPENARRHGKRNLDAIADSLRRFGQQKPIVVDFNDVVRAGNGQFAAAKSLGWSHIEIVRSDLPSRELTAYAIADNRTAELAEWDSFVLNNQLLDDELGNVGFSVEEVHRFAEEIENILPPPPDIPALFEVVVECADEAGQKRVYDRMTTEGYSCRLFTL